MTTVTGPSGKALMMFQASKRVRPCRAVPATCKISSPGWSVALGPDATPAVREETVTLGARGTRKAACPRCPRTQHGLQESRAPLPWGLGVGSATRRLGEGGPTEKGAAASALWFLGRYSPCLSPGRETLVTCVGGGRSRELERFLFGGLARLVGCGQPGEETWALVSGTCSSPASWGSRAVLLWMPTGSFLSV